MGQSMQTIKRRIRSIQSTMKITNAMELVATSKLQRQKSKMEQNKEYANYLYDTIARVLSVYQDREHVYLKKRNFELLLESGDNRHSESGEKSQSESSNKNQSPGLCLMN